MNLKIAAISSFILPCTAYLFGSCDPCCPERGPDWMVTPNAGPCVSRGYDAHVTLEFLYWTAREDRLEFGVVTPFENLSASSKGKVVGPDWNFQPGFKVGIGILFDHDGWDFYANYTWFRGRDTKKSINLTQNERGLGQADLTRIQGAWDLDFNVIDLELGRNFFISRFLTLRPHFGLKGTWQEQRFDLDQFSDGLQVKAHNRSNDWGIGMRAGLNSSWYFNGCFSAVGEIAVTALWESINADYKREELSASGIRIPFWFENCFSTVAPVVELYLGLRFETWLCCDLYHFSLEGGWELQWWEDQNPFFLDPSLFRKGDLFLNGLTLKARFDF